MPSLRAARRVALSHPIQVWLATIMLVGIMLLGTYLQPILRIADERFHVDMIHAATDADGYPEVRGRRLSGAVVAASLISRVEVSQSAPPPPRSATTASDEELVCAPATRKPVCSSRPTFEELGRAYADYRGPTNRMTQHPPAYYLLAGHTTSTFTTLTMRTVPYDAQVWLVRVVSILLVAPVTVLASRAAQEFGLSRTAQVVSAILPATMVGLTLRNAPMVNNDNLLTLLGAVLLVLLARACARGLTDRRAVAIGAILGLALLTKGTAMLMAAAVPPAYLLVELQRPVAMFERFRRLTRSTAITVATTLVAGGWWQVRNLVVYGTLQPAGGQRPLAEPSFEPSLTDWFVVYARGLARTAFGETGRDLTQSPLWLRMAIIVGVAGLLGLGARALGWRAAAALNLPFLTTFVGWALNSWVEYTNTGVAAAWNARYYYPMLVGLFVTVAAGVTYLGRRSAPRWRTPTLVIAALCLVVLTTRSEILSTLAQVWSPTGATVDGLQQLRLWAPAPMWLGWTGLALAALAAVLIVVTQLTWSRSR